MAGISHLLPELRKLFHLVLQLWALRLADVIRQLFTQARKTRRGQLEGQIIDSVAGTDGWRSAWEVRSGQLLAVLWSDIGLRERVLQPGRGRRRWQPMRPLASALEIRHRFRTWRLPSEKEIDVAMSSMATRGLL